MSGIYGLEMLLPLSTTKTLDIIHRTNIRKWQAKKLSRDWGPKEQYGGWFPGFSIFASYIPHLELKKPETWKCQYV